MQVKKTHLLEDLRRRATRLEPHLSNPASETAYRQVTSRIELLEKTPGETVEEVQSHLRGVARRAALIQTGKLAVCAGFVAGLVTVASLPNPGVLPVLGGFGCIGGAIGVGLWSVIEQVDREMALEGVRALDEEVARSSSVPAGPDRTGNLIGAPTVSLGGQASVGQLRSLLEATSIVLAADPDPEAAPARALLAQDLKRLKGKPDEPLTDLHERLDRRDLWLNRAGSLSPWALGAGMLVTAAGHPAIGLTLAAAAVSVLPVMILWDTKNLRETLDRWEPQLDSFRQAHRSADEVRHWTIQGSGSGVVEGEHSVQIGGTIVRLRPRPDPVQRR